MNVKKSDRILFFALFVPTLAFCVLILIRVLNKNSVYPDLARLNKENVQQAQSKMAIWATNQFFPIANTNELLVLLLSLNLDSGTNKLDRIQGEKLKKSIFDFLIAFHAGDYSAYKQFRLQDRWQIDKKYFEKIVEYITKNTRKSASEVKNKPEDEIIEMFVKLRSNETLYENYFTSISPKNIEIQFSTFNQVSFDLAKEVKKQNGTNDIGVASYNSIFSFERSPKAILDENGSVLCATVKILIETKEPNAADMPCPVYLSFIWDEKTSKWQPWQLASGNFWQKSKVIMVF